MKKKKKKKKIAKVSPTPNLLYIFIRCFFQVLDPPYTINQNLISYFCTLQNISWSITVIWLDYYLYLFHFFFFCLLACISVWINNDGEKNPTIGGGSILWLFRLFFFSNFPPTLLKWLFGLPSCGAVVSWVDSTHIRRFLGGFTWSWRTDVHYLKIFSPPDFENLNDGSLVHDPAQTKGKKKKPQIKAGL